MRHRVANSLQIIASILMLKARAVSSEETRSQLHDAHRRVMSVAVVQEHLHETDGIEQINVKTYLEKLCAGLAVSMVGEAQPVAIKVTADGGMVPSATAVSLGLIVTELVINALKHGFTTPKADAVILVTYEIDGSDWKLAVSDNGIGNTADAVGGPGSGLGTTIVKALATQLDARVETDSKSSGLSVAVTHTTVSSRMPPAGLSGDPRAPTGRAA